MRTEQERGFSVGIMDFSLTCFFYRLMEIISLVYIDTSLLLLEFDPKFRDVVFGKKTMY